MHIADLFERDSVTFSFEFFPPKTAEAAEKLFASIRELERLKPTFVDVTYGAGGSTRELTHELVLRIRKETRLTTIPHLTCVCHSRQEVHAILERYAAANIRNILALGGDLPRDRADWDRGKDAFRYAADLVKYIRDFQHPNFDGSDFRGRGFGIGIAGFPEGHPTTPNRLLEMDYLKAKVDAGADYIVTQLFFDNRDFYDFRERCELAGIGVPILAGIMPVNSHKGMRRMADLAAGARYPAALLRAAQRCADDEALRRVGVHWATEQCRDLLDHQVRGIHFYTLNQSDATRQIYENLGVTDSAGLQK